MWKRFVVAAMLAFVVAVPVARAADSAPPTLFCKGTIDALLVGAHGDVHVRPSWRQNWIELCNVDTPWLGISTKTCSVWVSELMTAHTTRKLTTIRYDGTGILSCDVIPPYENAPLAGYVLLEE